MLEPVIQIYGNQVSHKSFLKNQVFLLKNIKNNYSTLTQPARPFTHRGPIFLLIVFAGRSCHNYQTQRFNSGFYFDKINSFNILMNLRAVFWITS